MTERFKDKTWVKATVMWYVILAWIGLAIMFGSLEWYIMFGMWIGSSILIGVPYVFYKIYQSWDE